MSLTDPKSITISGTTLSLPRTSTGANASTYSSADGTVQVLASHTLGKRNRRVLRIDHSKISSDVFVPAQNVKLSMSNYIVFDVPPVGYTIAEQKAVFDGFRTMFSASSDADITKLLGGES